MANARLESEFGYEHDELIGQHIEVLVPESLRSVHALARSDYLTQAETRRMGVLEVFGRRKDGSQIPVQIGLNAILTSSGVYALASVVNVSERIRVDDEHRRALEELVEFERLVGDIAARFVNLEPADVDDAIVDAQRRIVEALESRSQLAVSAVRRRLR